MKTIFVALTLLLMIGLSGETFTGTGNSEKEIQISGSKVSVKISNAQVTLEDESGEETDLVTGTCLVTPGKNTVHIVSDTTWTVTIGGAITTTTPKVDNIATEKIKKVAKKSTSKWPTIETFEIDSKKFIVRLRKVNYKWKKINANPFLSANQHWIMKERVYLAVDKAGWDEKITDGLWQAVEIAMNTSEAEGVQTREIKKNETIQWMYSGGARNNEITLDVGKIIVDIEYYYKYHYDDKGNFLRREKVKIDKNDHINGKSYTFEYKGKVYELLWFEGSLGGIDQCGNLAGRSFPATK
jgi:hypothetical protein